MTTEKTSKCSFLVTEIFDRIKSKLNISQDNELAAFFGESPNKLATWKTRNTIPFELLIQKSIEGYFDFYEILNIGTTKRSDLSFDEIPLMKWYTGGSEANGPIQLELRETLKVPGVSATGTYALKVVSDSMVNIVFPGDILICREIPLKMVRIGYTYVFITENGTDVKQFFYDNGRIRLCSYNRIHPDLYPEKLHRSFEILRVLHEFREVETFEFSFQLNEINKKFEAISQKLGVES